MQNLRLFLLTAALTLAACGSENADSYGNFEADEVSVSSQLAGVLDRFDLQEGASIGAGASVAQIDTVPLSLQRQELLVQLAVADARAEEARAQVRVLQTQLRTVRTDLERTNRLFSGNAATAGEVTRQEGNADALEQQILAARARVDLVVQERASVEARLRSAADQIARGTVRNPSAGTVLTTFVEAGEYVQPGRVLYTVAAIDTLTLRAYVSGGQLSAIRVGQEVGVQYDSGSATLAQTRGHIVWISPVAEFTPTPIQTREERVDQVYAVKVRVPNPSGHLKIGMPGEVVFEPVGDEAGR